MSDLAEMRAARALLLNAADQFNVASAENLATLRRTAENWPGESGRALRELFERLSEQDRLHLAHVRNIAHHLPVSNPVDTDDEILRPHVCAYD
jgi:hypothetical protein